MEFNTCQNFEAGTDVFTCNSGGIEAIEHQHFLDGENFLFNVQSLSSVDFAARMDFVPASSSNLVTIFSPVPNSVEFCDEFSVYGGPDVKFDADLPQLISDNNDGSTNSCNYQISNISDFFISDMIVADIPFDGNIIYDETADCNPFLAFTCAEKDVTFDVGERYVMLPLCKDMVDASNISSEEKSHDSNLCLTIDKLVSDSQGCQVRPPNLVQTECLECQFLDNDMARLSDASWPSESPEAQIKRITLVLDLDETLVHSTLAQSDNADFILKVFFNMKERTVYVKQRPFLQKFLARVAEIFDIVVFTASQSIYAEQLLDRLDPGGNLISRRAYRESCIFSDGSCTKDLTVLGIDLAKVAIVDNSPQVFRLQVDNGIPIKSWFDDPSDDALVSLLPFLEILADADDVRPLIAKTFGNKV